MFLYLAVATMIFLMVLMMMKIFEAVATTMLGIMFLGIGDDYDIYPHRGLGEEGRKQLYSCLGN